MSGILSRLRSCRHFRAHSVVAVGCRILIAHVILILTSINPVVAQSVVDRRLSMFDPESMVVLPGNYGQMVQRFELPFVFTVKSVTIWLDGPAAANGRLNFYGHEAGTSFPQFEQKLLEDIQFVKTKDGKERIEMMLPAPLTFRNEQCFVAISDIQGGCLIYSSSELRRAGCTSSSGGDFYYQFNKSTSAQWSVGARLALAVELQGNAEIYEQPLLADVTRESGIDSTLSNSTMAWADVNGDGSQDFLVSGHIYINMGAGDGKVTRFEDYTLMYGLPQSARAHVVTDMDNDGDPDILLVESDGSLTLYEQAAALPLIPHQPVGTKFRDVSSLSVADINSDGYPDVFIGQLWGTYPVPGTNYLLLGGPAFSLNDATNLLYPDYDGISNFPRSIVCDPNNQNTWLSGGNNNRRSRGSQWVDVDLDGDQDLFVTNYFLERDELFLNERNGSAFVSAIDYTEIDKNRTSSNHGTGVHWADFDNDGDPDLLLPQFAHPGYSLQYDHRATTIYVNQGNLEFEDSYPSNGIEFEETYAGGTWGDVNNDGLLDFFNTVFYGCRYVKLYIQQPDHSFRLEIHRYGVHGLNTGQDAVWVDFNGDGLLDLCTGKDGRVRLFQNIDPNAGRAIQFRLAAKSNSQAIGAKLEIETAAGKQYRTVDVGRGVRMQDPNLLHFGTGDEEVVFRAKVTWPDGEEEYGGPFITKAVPGRMEPIVWSQGRGVHGLFGEDLDEKRIHLIVFPNPIQYDKTKAYIGIQKDSKLIMSDLTGRIVFKEKLMTPKTDGSQGPFTFIRSIPGALASGVYVVQVVETGGTELSEKIRIVVP